MIIASLVAALLVQSTAASSAANDTSLPNQRQQEAAASSQASDQRLVCRRDHVVGSLRPVRVCRTASEWAALRDQSREMAERARQETPNNAPSGRDR